MRENQDPRERREHREHREKLDGPVASLVPLLVDETTRVRANAPTRVARRAASAPRDATKSERPVPATIDVGDLPTLVVPRQRSMSSGARRRPHEVAEDVASDFGVSPFDSDIQTDVDAHDDSSLDLAPPSAVTSMADVWRDADARVPLSAPPPTSLPVDSVDVLEAVPLDVDVAPLDIAVSPRRTPRWSGVLLLAMAFACALFVDDAALARTVSLGQSAVVAAGAAVNDVVPHLRALEAQARLR